MMCHGSGSQMRGKTAPILLLLVLLVCHAFSSAHCSRHLDDWHYILRKECKLSSCIDLASRSVCFCCLATPDSPCWNTERECKEICSQVQLPPSSSSSSAATNQAKIS